MLDNADGRFNCYHIPISLDRIIFFLILSVALLAISSFGTLILLSFNADPPVIFLIDITLLVQEINFVLLE